jgi:antitoxin CptB
MSRLREGNIASLKVIRVYLGGSMQNNQIRWQCRRGMLELDLILLKYFDGCFEKLVETDQQLFTQFLREPDQTLYRWLMGQNCPDDPQLAILVQNIRSYTAAQ